MQTMLEVWDGVSFHHHPYRETGVSVLTAVDEIQTMLDDQLVKTQTMRGSPFIKPVESEIKVGFKFQKVCLPNYVMMCILYESLIWLFFSFLILVMLIPREI